MYATLDAHPLTIIIVVGTLMVTPLYVFATYVFSGASRQKGLRIAFALLPLGGFMFWVCVSGLPGRLGMPGYLIIPAAWALPSLLLFFCRKWFVAERLCQKWLVGLQLFRAIGAVFLLEMLRGKIPSIFAYPAGVGDIIAAFTSLVVLLRYSSSKTIPGLGIALVIMVGMTDFLSAFFFGVFSSPTPVQLFFPPIANNVTSFPSGLIPLFLVPYAIFFHVLSGLNYIMHDRIVVSAGGWRRRSVTSLLRFIAAS